ncbi:MAG: nucleoside triphosphate pyrophosphohydrolase [Flavobacteriales bacterium]|nr:nucleoside triphosphate pyrophosphohydrolase [Flavobacteriales bacterium]OUW97801.1 MAG: nucleoside triphosphate pyrophosphohydrolase [Flavobacteriales bacterium TMED228]
MKNKAKAFIRLVEIMDRLREECPWDKKQTIDSLRYLTIEEMYELSDAILDKNMDEIKKELGDLMLHIVFYSRIASEKKHFDITDVLDSISDKLIHRHPHIYGDVVANDVKQVKENWEKLKLKEGKKSVLEGVPKSLPAIVKAYRIQEKVRGIGFDWQNKNQVWDKFQEEIEEFQREEKKNDSEKMEEEFGDVLFSLVNYSRFVNINPEDALEKTNKKFIRRFQFMEQKIKEDGLDLSKLSFEQMNTFWDMAKIACLK